MQATDMILTSTEKVSLGTRAPAAIAALAVERDASHVLIIAGKTLRENTSEITAIEEALGKRHAMTFSGIQPHAPRSDVLAAAEAARTSSADLIVTVGGGSVTDAGKIVPLLLRHDVRSIEGFETLRTFVDADGLVVNPITDGPDIPVVCVPTTLSGGEFNTLSGATDEATQHKQGYEHRGMAPIAVVLDPELTRHTPEWLWLSTGVRAVDHAVETLASYRSNHFADGMAESALRLLSDGLGRVAADPGDMDARLKCQVGAWQSMIPIIGGVPMGASHAIGHILGGTCDVPHGYTSCVMSPFVLAWNAEYDASRQSRISAAMGAKGEAASVVLDRFIASLGMPRSLTAIGVTSERFEQIADYTMLDIWGRTNPRPVSSPADILEILRMAA